MRMNINEMPLTPEERRQNSLKILKTLRPIDDTFMRELFRNDLELAIYAAYNSCKTRSDTHERRNTV